MPKAILELEMPESCSSCPLRSYIDLPRDPHGKTNETVLICYITGGKCWRVGQEGRRPDCPLKLVEGCGWILIDDDKGLWQCSKCGAEWVLEAGTPVDNEINYCPMCGKRLEVE